MKAKKETPHLRAEGNLLLLIWLVIFPCSSFAQRGFSHTKINDRLEGEAWPSQGFSGFFDAEVPTEGSLSFDVPTFSFDYGVNDRWSIGTNALMSLLTLMELSSGNREKNHLLLLKTRYKIFGHGNWEGSVSGYFGSLKFNTKANISDLNNLSSESGSTSQKSEWLVSTLNISKLLNNNKFGISTALLQIEDEATATGTTGKSVERITSLLLSPWHRYRISQSFELESLAVICPWSRGIQNNPMFRMETQNDCIRGSFPYSFLRFISNWRSSDSWLWTFGVMSFPGLKPTLLPNLGVTYVLNSKSKTELISLKDNK
jgi:hypothetical protein